MNILIFNWRDPKNPQSGGAEVVTLEHAKRWIKKGHQVTWFTSQFKNSLEKEMLNDVAIIRKGSFLSVFLYAPFFYLSQRKKFDVIIDEIHGLPFFTPLFVRKPKITFIHEVAAEIWDYMYPFPFNRVGKFVEPLYFKLYQSLPFWTDAPSTIDELVKFGVKKDRCVAIACPIINKPLTKLPKKEKDPTFIFVSRLVKMKGIEEIIKAFGFIAIENKHAKLWIVGRGDPEYVASLRMMAQQYHVEKQITFFGSVSDEKKLELLRKAHVILHASIKEGWGLVIIEAASQGTPAVVYNVTGLKDSVKHNKTGIVLQENSPKELAMQALLMIRKSRKYKAFQKECLLWAKSLTWEKASNQSLALLEKVHNIEKR